MPYKIERLERTIEKEIGTILLNSKDARLRFVTVTKVHLTGDASIATVFYTVLGNPDQIESTKKNLENAKGFIRSSLGKGWIKFISLLFEKVFFLFTFAIFLILFIYN